MENNFIYSNDNKRYHTLTYFYQTKFKQKICKVSLNANFTCPNIDGSKGKGGCIYCSKLGSGDFAGNPKEDLSLQFLKGKEKMQKKWPQAKFIAYFQAHSNTYGPLSKLKACYEPFLKEPDCLGIAIATRSDCINDECLDYLEALSKKTFLIVELGLQTIHEKTANLINRCLTLENFEQCVKKLKARNIYVVVHIINGLPYETKEDMIETAKYLNNLNINGIKIHMLHILKDTKLAKMYQEHKFPILTREEYVDITVNQLEYLNPKIVIHRLTGDPVKEELIEPEWVLKKFQVLNEIDKKMAKENIYQGDKV